MTTEQIDNPPGLVYPRTITRDDRGSRNRTRMTRMQRMTAELENSISIQIEFCIRPAMVGLAGIETGVNDNAWL